MDGTPTVANPYHHVDNDPLNKVDPSGLRPEDDHDIWDGCTSCFGPFPPGSPTTDEAEPATPVVAELNFCGGDPGEPPAPPTTVVLSVEQVLDRCVPNWRNFGARLIGPPCRDTAGGDHQGIANPATGDF